MWVENWHLCISLFGHIVRTLDEAGAKNNLTASPYRTADHHDALVLRG